MPETRKYGEAEMVYSSGPWAQIIGARKVLCEDGVRRNTTRVGMPDTFFSLPAAVSVKGKTVSGFLMIDNDSDIKFLVYSYRKNAHMIEKKENNNAR